MVQTPTKTTPRDLLRVVFRRRLLFLIGAGLFAFVALVGACWYPLKYTGSAQFERRSDLASGGAGNFDTQKLVLENELSGQNALEAAVDKLEKQKLIDPLPRSSDGKLVPEGQIARQEWVRVLRADAHVGFDVRSPSVDLVSVTFTSRNPKLAQELPNILMNSYIERISDQIVANLKQGHDYLLRKSKEANEKLTEANNQKIKFEKDHAKQMPADPSVLTLQMERVSTDIEAVTRLRDSTQRKLDGWKVLLANLGTTEDLQMLGPGKPEGTASSTATNTSADKKDKAALASDSERPPDSVIKGPNPDLQKDREELRGLKKRLDDARVNMKDEHPTVISLRKQIAELQERIASEPEVVPIQWVWNPARGSSTSSAAGGPVVDQNRVLRDAMFRQEITNATEELAHQNKDLEKLRERQASLTDLMNNLEVIRQNYAEVSKAVTAAVKEADGYQTQLAAIDQQLGAEIAKHGTLLNAMTFAEEQFTPSSPKLSYVLAFALLGGLAFGAGLVFLSNMMDRSISTTEEAAEYFGLPVYGVVGEIVTPRQRTTRKIRRLIVGPAVTLIVVVSLGCASLNIVLWLQYRNLHEGWKRAPVTFIASQVQAAFDNLKSRI